MDDARALVLDQPAGAPVTDAKPVTLPSEFALAAACCRWAYSGEGEDRVRRLARQAEWSTFLDTCRRHRVQGLVWHCLNGLQIPLPSDIGERLASDARRIAEQCLRSAGESARLLVGFEQAGIRLLFVKGLTLGALAYGNPFLKMSSDVDLVVPPQSVKAAARLLDSLGYKLVIPATNFPSAEFEQWHARSKESVWRLEDGVVVELHGRLADNPGLIGGIDANSPSQLVEVAAGIRLPTLADEHLFAYLCVHGASSAWFRLKWITDLAGFLHRFGPDDISRLYERSQQLGAARSAGQALLLAHWLYGTPIDTALRRSLDRPATRWLATAALRQMCGRRADREPTQRPLGTAMIHLTQFLLKPGAAFKLKELVRQVRAPRT